MLLLTALAAATFLALRAAPPAEAQGSFPGQGFLPDNRAWEMVSPPDKNGGEVMGDTTKVTAALDGDSIAFTSLGGFPGTEGSALAIDYISSRDPGAGANGWSTRSIAPHPQEPLPVRFATSQATSYRLFSPDLSRGILRAVSPLTDAPNVAATRNLYLRSDLADPRGGHYDLLTDAFEPLKTEAFFTIGIDQPWIADASADFRHVIFESRQVLTADAPPCAAEDPNECPLKLYEWADGTVRLAGVLPLPDGSAAESSQAGKGAYQRYYQAHHDTISDDGRRVFFTSPALNTGVGDLYMRVDGAETVQLNASERAVPDSPQPAEFLNATPDGRYSFFKTREALTEDDGNDHPDFYRYDAEATAGARLTRLSQAPGGGDTQALRGIGVSDDGRSAYFIGEGQAIPGEPTDPARRIYLWRDGELHDVGGVSAATYESLTGGNQYTLELKAARVSPDGRYLAFSSDSGLGLTGYDHGDDGSGSGFQQLYLYDAQANGGAGELRCVSCNRNAAVASASSVFHARVGLSLTDPRPYLNRALMDDGRVFFTTGESLVPEDVNGGVRDAYQYDPVTDQVSLLSSGESGAHSYFMDASPDGRDVFILTRDRLSRWDVDRAYDLYNAREGGGLPEPPPSPPACQGDACQPRGSEPEDQTPGSADFEGQGNVRPASDCVAFARKAKRSGQRAKSQRQRAKSLRQRAKRQARQGNPARAKRIRQRVKRVGRKAHASRQRAKRLRTRAKRCRDARKRANANRRAER